MLMSRLMRLERLGRRQPKAEPDLNRMLPKDIDDPQVSADYARRREQIRRELDSEVDPVDIRQRASADITYYRQQVEALSANAATPSSVLGHFTKRLESVIYRARHAGAVVEDMADRPAAE